MALSFPLSRAAFLDLLPVTDMPFDLPEAVEINEMASGGLLAAELGESLWQGECRLDVLTREEARQVRALLNLARRADASVLLHDINLPYPAADPKGLGLAGLSPVLAAVSTDGRDIAIGGMVAGYQLQPGDRIGMTYGTPSVRRLYEVAVGATAGAGGIIEDVQVVPPMGPGWSIGQAVVLAKPAVKAIIVPGSVQIGRRDAGVIKGASFRWMQTLG